MEKDFKILLHSIKQIKQQQEQSKEPEQYEQILSNLDKIKAEILQFKQKVPLLFALKRDGMKERHWQEIIDRTGLAFNFREQFSFQELVNLGLLQHVQTCNEIGEKAYREKGIEQTLADMKEAHQKIVFSLKDYQFSGSYVVSNFEEVEQVLDQHLSDTQALQSNPYKKIFIEEIERWLENLLVISQVIEAWQRFQQNWCYLLPIFDSPDINKQLPKESSLFKRVDSTWRGILHETRLQKVVIKVCNQENMFERIQESNQIFENILNELKSYLEIKRTKFGRFYFLSNDDLLMILSQNKDTDFIQDHLRKVFENIASLEFTADKKIKSMISSEKESVDFFKAVDLKMKQVEDWMGDVESGMVLTMKKKLLDAVSSYSQQVRNSWILVFPGQCVLNGSQIHWTQQTEEAINKGQLPKYIAFLQQQLKRLVQIDRQNLSKNQFVTIEALIVIDVHAKDVVENLIGQQVKNA